MLALDFPSIQKQHWTSDPPASTSQVLEIKVSIALFSLYVGGEQTKGPLGARQAHV